MYLLYLFQKKAEDCCDPERFKKMVFYPKLIPGKMSIKGELLSIKAMLVRASFILLTLNKVAICYVIQDGRIAHTSYVIPKCGKFPFMKKKDYEIGPCYTAPESRGRGIYPDVIRFICSSFSEAPSVFYMIVDDGNIPSIRGIEKAGFVCIGKVRKTKILKKYVLTDK